jgi:hypothetical protein
VTAVLAGWLAVAGCGGPSAGSDGAAANRQPISFNPQPLLDELTAALAAKNRDGFLAPFAASAKPAAASWWDNLAALGFTTGAVATLRPGVTIDRSGNATMTIIAGARSDLDPVNADLKRENAVPTTEYEIGLRLDDGAKTPVITSWTSVQHAPWDDGKSMYVRRLDTVVVAGYADERAAVDQVADAAKKAADYDIAYYRSVAATLLHQPGFVVFTSASQSVRNLWFSGGTQPRGWTGEADGRSQPLPGISTHLGWAQPVLSTVAARVVVRPDLGDQETSTLVHEFIHANLASRAAAYYGADGQSMPAWVSEGIARLIEYTYLSNPDPTLQHYSAQRLKDSLATVPKNKLTGVPPTDNQLYGGTQDDGRQWYDVAASVYYYIAFKYSAFKALAAAQESYADGVPFAKVINTVGSNGTATMYDPTVIRQDWQAWLAQNYG